MVLLIRTGILHARAQVVSRKIASASRMLESEMAEHELDELQEKRMLVHAGC
jgi:hypothetical protein